MSRAESASRGSPRMRIYIAIGLIVLAAIYTVSRLTLAPNPLPPPDFGGPPGLAGPGPGTAPGLAPGLNGPATGTAPGLAPGLNPNP